MHDGDDDGGEDDDDDDKLMIIIIGCACGALCVVLLITILCCCTVRSCPCYWCCHTRYQRNTIINLADGGDRDRLLDKPTPSNICCNCF